MADIGVDLSRYALGWHDEVVYVFKPKRGLERRHRQRDLGHQGRAPVDARLPVEVAAPLREAADAQLGRRSLRDLLRQHLLLHQADRPSGRRVGRVARVGEEDLREARHSRSRAQVPRGRHRAVRERSRLPPQPRRSRRPRRDLLRHGHGVARVSRCRQEAHGQDHPAQRQQVLCAQLRGVERWLVHLRAAGRQGADAVAGVLPHQLREHGPVRAHADHRRRRLRGALHRRAARRPSTPPIRCIRPSSRFSSASRRASPTRPSRTGRTTSSTW